MFTKEWNQNNTILQIGQIKTFDTKSVQTKRNGIDELE